MLLDQAQLPLSLALALIVIAIIAVALWRFVRQQRGNLALKSTTTSDKSTTNPETGQRLGLEQRPPRDTHISPKQSELRKQPYSYPQLREIRNWSYQLQDLNVDAAARSQFDCLVIDPSEDGDDTSALSVAQVNKLQHKPDGRRRIILAYLSVGEAESYRSYWKKAWFKKAPDWLLAENPDWEQNFTVRFWRKDWQKLMFGNRRASLDKIMAQGFDGVYLDKCDVYEDIQRRHNSVAASRRNLRGDMVTYIERLSRYAKSKRTGFYMVMQNAEDLLSEPKIQAALDGVAKEELIFGLDGGEARNPADDFDYSRQQLDKAKAQGLPVMVVEYLDTGAKRAVALELTRKHGYILHLASKNRELAELGSLDADQVS